MVQVQSGGSFDVDYSVTGPNEKVIMEGSKERQGDFVFTAKEQGEYRFCFNNEMSTFAEKMVDFEIAVENESRDAQLPSKQGTSPEQTSALEESILKISRDLSTINRNQKYFRTRENRNMSTVKSTEGRIFNFSVAESALMVSMAGLQVFIVRFFFQGARKAIAFTYHALKLFPFIMSSPLQQVQYTSNQAAQETFTSHYDVASGDPTVALNSYMKSIHKYTQAQLDSIKRSKERRTDASKGVSQVAALTPESSVNSVESVEDT
ncbi:MAG: hypothetical protein Q9208_001166 [Pyrenodesmia sp. 3 TL-2023]